VTRFLRFAFALAFLVQEAIDAMRPGGTLHPWRRGALPIVAAAGVPVGPILIQTKMGAPLATVAGTLLAFAAARLLRVGRFAN
jgi:hypothetical protein